MPSTKDLLHMYHTAKSVLHIRLAEELASQIGNSFIAENNRREQSAITYLHGQNVSDLYGKSKTLRSLTEADVNQSSSDFLTNFWHTLVNLVGAGRLLAGVGISPYEINPVQVVEKDGFVDLQIDFTSAIEVYRTYD